MTGPALRTPLNDSLSECDFLSLHVPLIPDTAGMIGARELTLMKPSAVVINTARGGVLDEQGIFPVPRGT